MDALLLAAGLGTRLKPITNSIPKCMVSICGRPLIDYWIELFANNSNIDSIFINTFYLPEVVKEYVNNNKHRKKIILLNEKKLYGTGGTLVNTIPLIKSEDVLVAHSDNLTVFNLNKFITRHMERPVACEATIMTFITDDPKSCGIIELDDDGKLIKMHEKVEYPPGFLANGAVYIFNKNILHEFTKIKELKKVEVLDISCEFMPLLFGRAITYHNTIYHRDIGNMKSLEIANRDFNLIYSSYQSRAIL